MVVAEESDPVRGVAASRGLRAGRTARAPTCDRPATRDRPWACHTGTRLGNDQLPRRRHQPLELGPPEDGQRVASRALAAHLVSEWRRADRGLGPARPSGASRLRPPGPLPSSLSLSWSVSNVVSSAMAMSNRVEVLGPLHPGGVGQLVCSRLEPRGWPRARRGRGATRRPRALRRTPGGGEHLLRHNGGLRGTSAPTRRIRPRAKGSRALQPPQKPRVAGSPVPVAASAWTAARHRDATSRILTSSRSSSRSSHTRSTTRLAA